MEKWWSRGPLYHKDTRLDYRTEGIEEHHLWCTFCKIGKCHLSRYTSHGALKTSPRLFSVMILSSINKIFLKILWYFYIGDGVINSSPSYLCFLLHPFWSMELKISSLFGAFFFTWIMLVSGLHLPRFFFYSYQGMNKVFMFFTDSRLHENCTIIPWSKSQLFIKLKLKKKLW